VRGGKILCAEKKITPPCPIESRPVARRGRRSASDEQNEPSPPALLSRGRFRHDGVPAPWSNEETFAAAEPNLAFPFRSRESAPSSRWRKLQDAAGDLPSPAS